MNYFKYLFAFLLAVHVSFGMETLPLTVDVQGFMFWNWLDFSGAPKFSKAIKTGCSNLKVASVYKGDFDRMHKAGSEIPQEDRRARLYHANAALVYYLYVAYNTRNDITHEALHKKARNSLIEIVKYHSPSDELVDCCCYALGSDKEFVELYESQYQVGMGCSIM